MEQDYILKVEHVSKQFPGVKALDDVSIGVRRGTVHALVGENGAGKSTLIKILAGIYQSYEGSAYIDGKKVNFRKPSDAQAAGISVVHQELKLAESLSVSENIFLGAPVQRIKGWVDWERMNRQAQELTDQLRVKLDVTQPVQELTIAKKQIVEICKAIVYQCKVLIMDEPSATLTKNELDVLFETIRRLRSQGVTIIYISHRMEEIFQLADDVSILRDGKFIGTLPVAKTNQEEYDAIFILTSFTDAILPYVQQATDAGIPVIAMDGTLEGPPLVSHIVWDQAYTGKVLAEKAGDYIENELNGEARIVCLDSKSLEYMAVRQKAFLETLDERFGDKITIVNDSDCQTREEAMNTIVSISDSYDLVYAASDSNAHGAVAGMQSKGITGVPIYACGGFGEELYKAITDPDSPFFAVINIPGESIVSSAYEMLLKYLNGDTDIPEHVNCEVLYVDKNSPEDVLATLKP